MTAACRFVYETPMPVGRLVRQVADKHQVCTQRSWKRPFGVGMLVGGYDKTGPHLYNTCPSGNYYEYKAMAIGARSQVCASTSAIGESSYFWHGVGAAGAAWGIPHWAHLSEAELKAVAGGGREKGGLWRKG